MVIRDFMYELLLILTAKQGVEFILQEKKNEWCVIFRGTLNTYQRL